MPNENSAAEQQLEAQRKAREEAVQEMDKRAAEATPTPTQDENDRAKLGILPADGLEDDGSPSEADAAVQRAQAAVKEAEAQRDADAQRTAEAQKGNAEAQKAAEAQPRSTQAESGANYKTRDAAAKKT